MKRKYKSLFLIFSFFVSTSFSMVSCGLNSKSEKKLFISDIDFSKKVGKNSSITTKINIEDQNSKEKKKDSQTQNNINNNNNIENGSLNNNSHNQKINEKDTPLSNNDKNNGNNGDVTTNETEINKDDNKQNDNDISSPGTNINEKNDEYLYKRFDFSIEEYDDITNSTDVLLTIFVDGQIKKERNDLKYKDKINLKLAIKNDNAWEETKTETKLVASYFTSKSVDSSNGNQFESEIQFYIEGLKNGSTYKITEISIDSVLVKAPNNYPEFIVNQNVPEADNSSDTAGGNDFNNNSNEGSMSTENNYSNAFVIKSISIINDLTDQKVIQIDINSEFDINQDQNRNEIFVEYSIYENETKVGTKTINNGEVATEIENGLEFQFEKTNQTTKIVIESVKFQNKPLDISNLEKEFILPVE